MKEIEKKFQKNIKEENEIFAKEKEKIIQKKKESVRIIESNKRAKIDESNKKYKNLLSYLDSIKNNKKKLIEFFQNNKYLV